MSHYAIVLFAVVLGASGVARAQERAGDATAPAGYREAISAAVQEYEAASYAEAREQFRRAHVLFPNARTLRGLGVTEFELHNYPEAIGHFEEALASRVRPLDGSVRAETQTLLQRARGYVGSIQVELDPVGARLTVDGQRVERVAGRPLLLSVGDHTLEASATGRFAERRMLKVAGGQKQTVSFKLAVVETASSAVAGSVPIQQERPTAAPLYKRWWLWTSVAVVAGGIAAGVFFATRKETTREVPRFTANTPPPKVALNPYSAEADR